MKTYTEILARLNGRASKKVGNNTYLHTFADNHGVALRLHSTDILTFRPDDSVVVTSGGWKTSTTKERLNSWLPHGWGISQRQGIWFWCRSGSDKPQPKFTDGDIIGPRGALLAQSGADVKAEREARREALRQAELNLSEARAAVLTQ